MDKEDGVAIKQNYEGDHRRINVKDALDDTSASSS